MNATFYAVFITYLSTTISVMACLISVGAMLINAHTMKKLQAVQKSIDHGLRKMADAETETPKNSGEL